MHIRKQHRLKNPRHLFWFFSVFIFQTATFRLIYDSSLQLMLSAVLGPQNVSPYYIIVQIMFLFPLGLLSLIWVL